MQVATMCPKRASLPPTEIVTAWEAGASAVKVFPARPFGPTYVKDMLAPLPELRLVPTGGVDLNNTGAYITHGAFAVGMGQAALDCALAHVVTRRQFGRALIRFQGVSHRLADAATHLEAARLLQSAHDAHPDWDEVAAKLARITDPG